MFDSEISIKQRTQLIISSKKSLDLDDFLKHLFAFQNFLVLALYRSTFPTAIYLLSENFKKYMGEGADPAKIRVILHFPISSRQQARNIDKHRTYLFRYPHIREEFPSMIEKWYKHHEILEPAFNLVFEQFYNSKRFSENTFLNLAQAAETFHARLHNHTKMDKTEYEEMKSSILSTALAKYHKWLNDQFTFGNSLNLHTRLTELVDRYATPLVMSLIGDKETFVKQVKWSRNYYTHYSSDGAKKALKKVDLFYLAEKLKLVLVCAFLVEIGFPKEKLNKLMEDSKYKHFYGLLSL